MSVSAEIDYLSSVDYAKGFKRFHVKWPLTDLTKPKRSAIFETTVIDGDRNITLKWSLVIRNSSKDPTKTWFGAHLATPEMITPMIYRVCLSSSTNILFDWSKFAVTYGTTGYGEHIPSSEVDAYPIHDLVLHFWIDIPNAIVIAINNLDEAKGVFWGQNSIQKACNVVLLSDNTQIFNRVLGPNVDPSSDISIIIVNEKDEELRRFRCHSHFLSSESSFFASEEWKGNCIKNGRSAKIKDVSAQVMEKVLQHIYTSTLPDPSIDHDHLCDIVIASDKYKIQKLKNWCIGVLKRKHDSNKCRIVQLVLADNHNLAQLKSVCIAQLLLNFSKLCLDLAAVTDIPSSLWLEIVKAVSDRQVNTTDIILAAA